MNHSDTWLYIGFVQLQLDHWQQRDNLWDQAALVVREQDQVIVQCNHIAQQAGIKAGMELSAAWLLADELEFCYEDPLQQAQRLTDIAARLYQRVADITIDKDGVGVWVHIYTQKLLYSNERQVEQVLLPLLADYQTTWCYASNPLCAKLGLDERRHSLATVAQNFSMAQTSLSKPLIHKLESMGLNSLDKVLQVPVQLLGKKLGEEIVRFYLQITGQQTQPMAPFHPPVDFYASRQLHAEASSWGGIRFVCKSLLQQLEQHLRTQQEATQRVDVILFTRNFHGNAQQPFTISAEGTQLITLALARPVFRAQDIYPILQLKLEPLKFNAPVVDVAIAVNETEPMQASPMLLMGAEGNNTELGVLLNRLQAKLGADQMVTIQPQLAWLPELQQSLQSVADKASGFNQQIEGWRPLWLQAPVAIDIEQWQLCGQPQRLALPWWLANSGVECRDYMLAQDQSGRWAWVFFNNSPDSAGGAMNASGCWYLHGWAS